MFYMVYEFTALRSACFVLLRDFSATELVFCFLLCNMNYLQTGRTAQLRDWQGELEENSLFLSSLEKQIAEDVFIEAECLVQSRGMPTCNDDKDEIFQKMSVVKENLKVIIKQFQMCRKDKQQFVREYPRWQRARSQSIDSLETIGNSIHIDRRKSNISRLVGNCTSFFGGGLLIASAALIPFTFGLTAPFAIAGGITTALGSATSIGTSITEVTLLRNKVEQAKAIVEEDRLAFEALKDWLTRANSVSEALNAILSIDVDNTIGNILETMKVFANLVVKVYDSTQKNTLIKGFLEVTLKRISPQFLLTNIFPRLISLLVVLSVQCNSNQTVFNHACKTWNTITNCKFYISNFSLGLLQPAVTAIIRTDSTVAQIAVTAAVTRGLIAGIGMSLDVASIVLTSIDVHNGSISKEGQKIIEAANKLKEEADVLDKVYTEIA